MLSVFLLFTETLISWADYGEHTHICGKVVQYFCQDKSDPSINPACFVQGADGPTNIHLQYDCTASNCYGYGWNYGSSDTNMTCNSDILLPFQDQPSLIRRYGTPTLFTSRPQMNRQSDPCLRIECNPPLAQIVDGNYFWIRSEFIITIIFSIEFFCRIAVADSVVRYLRDIMNFFDILAILPFYIELISAGGLKNLNFAILPSSPEHYIYVIARSFKVS